MAKAIRASIYRAAHHGDCSNGGISSRHDTVLILCDDGYIDVDLANPPDNLVEIVRRTLFGKEADYVRPFAPAAGVGWMDGGTIIDSCDGRFKSNHPLAFHDRDESWELYEALTR